MYVCIRTGIFDKSKTGSSLLQLCLQYCVVDRVLSSGCMCILYCLVVVVVARWHAGTQQCIGEAALICSCSCRTCGVQFVPNMFKTHLLQKMGCSLGSVALLVGCVATDTPSVLHVTSVVL